MSMTTEPSVQIRQKESYEGDEWWSWSIWVDGPDSELDEIDFVEYTLHPTFRNPVREVRNRTNKFMLSTAGWGGFDIYARVVRKDQKVLSLHHELVLHYPDGQPTDN